jgi:hypothetical protein
MLTRVTVGNEFPAWELLGMFCIHIARNSNVNMFYFILYFFSQSRGLFHYK